jgi:hypothetical protein
VGSEAERAQLSLGQHALVRLDCRNEFRTLGVLGVVEQGPMEEPNDEPSAGSYQGLEIFRAANRKLLFRRDGGTATVLHRIRSNHTRISVVGGNRLRQVFIDPRRLCPELTPETTRFGLRSQISSVRVPEPHVSGHRRRQVHVDLVLPAWIRPA